MDLTLWEVDENRVVFDAEDVMLWQASDVERMASGVDGVVPSDSAGPPRLEGGKEYVVGAITSFGEGHQGVFAVSELEAGKIRVNGSVDGLEGENPNLTVDDFRRSAAGSCDAKYG